MNASHAAVQHRLLNDYQRGFPLSGEPFKEIGNSLGVAASDVIARLKALQADGTVSRVGPVFRPNTVGASTLAAMAVEADQLERVAAIVNTFAEVNHNYEREHHYNLWFVVTARDREALEQTIARIETATSRRVLSLPLVRDYHIDLGFPLTEAAHATGKTQHMQSEPAPAVCVDDRLIAAIQGGLPLVERPFEKIASEIGKPESVVLKGIEQLQRLGIVRRFGIIVRHHELGFRANAMAVWDIDDAQVDELGARLGELPFVTLCYRRERRLPDWPYNLYCMVHGRAEAPVLECVRQINNDFGLADAPSEVLFSRRRFKQRGALYRFSTTRPKQASSAHGHA